MFASLLAAAAAPIVQTPPPVRVAEPSAAQRLFSTVGALWRNLSRLEPGEVALNLFLSVLVIAVTALVVWVLRRLLHAAVARVAHPGAEPHAPPVAGPRGARLTWSLLKAVLALITLVVVLSIWGVDLVGWLTTSGTGAVLLRLAAVVVIATAMVELAGHLVNRLLVPLTHRLSAERRAAQIRTLGPLLRGVLQGFIVVLASLTILSELGVKIGPLLASAGVVGIAVGFGAQTLVKDFLTGLFLVIEDIVAVGDIIRVGDRSGTVEAMTLRTLRLRSADGVLHILPYSEAQVISNQTKSFSSYVFDIGIGYGADIDHAFAVMRRVGAELQADPAYGEKILEPLEIMGVDALGESAVMLKARFRTRPGDQWSVGREYNRRIKYAFDAEGIEIPYTYRKLVIDGPVPVQPAPQPNEPE
jgi:small conductance mechanosensitive channel